MITSDYLKTIIIHIPKVVKTRSATKYFHISTNCLESLRFLVCIINVHKSFIGIIVHIKIRIIRAYNTLNLITVQCKIGVKNWWNDQIFRNSICKWRNVFHMENKIHIWSYVLLFIIVTFSILAILWCCKNSIWLNNLILWIVLEISSLSKNYAAYINFWHCQKCSDSLTTYIWLKHSREKKGEL